MGQAIFEKKNSYGVENLHERHITLYHVEDRNHCPNCAGIHWYIGRLTAECAQCGMALSLSVVSEQAEQPLYVSTSSSTIKERC